MRRAFDKDYRPVRISRLASYPLALLMYAWLSVAASNVSISDIKVFVFTREPDEGQLVNPQTAARNKQADNAVEQLKKELAKKVKVVEKRDQADVTIEVLPHGGVKAGTPTPDRDTATTSSGELNVALSAGSNRMNLTGHSSLAPPHGPTVDIAEKVEKWIEDSRGRLIANRATAIGPATVTK